MGSTHPKLAGRVGESAKLVCLLSETAQTSVRVALDPTVFTLAFGAISQACASCTGAGYNETECEHGYNTSHESCIHRICI